MATDRRSREGSLEPAEPIDQHAADAQQSTEQTRSRTSICAIENINDETSEKNECMRDGSELGVKVEEGGSKVDILAGPGQSGKVGGNRNADAY